MIHIQRPRFSLLWLLTIVVVVLVIFAAVFEIDQGVRAQGIVISGARTQVIQAVDGGMVVALHVREGDRVKAGQKLAELEPDRAQAGYKQGKAEVASKQIALLRTQAELSNTKPDFKKFKKNWASFVEAQQGIYQERKKSLDEDLAVLKDTLRLGKEELEMNKRLFQNGDISRSDVMRAERQVLDTEAKINATRNKYFQDTRMEQAKLEDELSANRHKLEERQNALEHTDLTSPMDGVVKVVKLTTVGGVLKPGDELMQISPLDDELILEIKVNPSDIGQLRTDLPVSVRMDAFDSSIYGKLDGTLRYISPDTLSEQGSNGQSTTYYRAQVVLNWPKDKNHAAQHIRAQDIKPGMTATADVLTGQRSILFYLIKPMTRAFSGALLQR
jgi:membrane fusion protein, adhesin transport system